MIAITVVTSGKFPGHFPEMFLHARFLHFIIGPDLPSLRLHSYTSAAFRLMPPIHPQRQFSLLLSFQDISWKYSQMLHSSITRLHLTCFSVLFYAVNVCDLPAAPASPNRSWHFSKVTTEFTGNIPLFSIHAVLRWTTAKLPNLPLLGYISATFLLSPALHAAPPCQPWL